MAINGKKFLDLNRTEKLTITQHALDRVYEYSQVRPTKGLASVMFHRSRHVKHPEMITLGYRPAYGRRLQRGEKSWYFRFKVFATELVAVISEKDSSGRFVWTTTYGCNEQTDLYRLGEQQMLAGTN